MRDDRAGLVSELDRLDAALRAEHDRVVERYFVRKATQHTVQTVSWTDGVAW